jgi:hypothetical protein
MPKAGTKHKAPKKGYDFYGPKYPWVVGRVEKSSYMPDPKKLGHKPRIEFQAARTLESVVRMSLENRTIAGLKAAQAPAEIEEVFDTTTDEEEGGWGMKDITLMGVDFIAEEDTVKGFVASIMTTDHELVADVKSFNNSDDADDWDIVWKDDVKEGVLEEFADYGETEEDILKKHGKDGSGGKWNLIYEAPVLTAKEKREAHKKALREAEEAKKAREEAEAKKLAKHQEWVKIRDAKRLAIKQAKEKEEQASMGDMVQPPKAPSPKFGRGPEATYELVEDERWYDSGGYRLIGGKMVYVESPFKQYFKIYKDPKTGKYPKEFYDKWNVEGSTPESYHEYLVKEGYDFTDLASKGYEPPEGM